MNEKDASDYTRRRAAVNRFLTGFGLIPTPLLFGLLAKWIKLTPAMLTVHVGATLVTMLVVWRLPGEEL